jgi:hypothetical protein
VSSHPLAELLREEPWFSLARSVGAAQAAWRLHQAQARERRRDWEDPRLLGAFGASYGAEAGFCALLFGYLEAFAMTSARLEDDDLTPEERSAEAAREQAVLERLREAANRLSATPAEAERALGWLTRRRAALANEEAVPEPDFDHDRLTEALDRVLAERCGVVVERAQDPAERARLFAAFRAGLTQSQHPRTVSVPVHLIPLIEVYRRLEAEGTPNAERFGAALAAETGMDEARARGLFERVRELAEDR